MATSEARRGSTVKYFKFIYLLSGVLLLAWILSETDLQEVMARVSQLGFWSALVVLFIYVVTYLVNVMSWQLTFKSVPFDGRWCWRLYLIRMAGDAYNNVTPAASLGGEPLKAAFLKEIYGVGLREASVSLVLAKTINMISLIVFLVVGFALLLQFDELSASYQALAATGLAVLTVLTIIFFFLQRLKVSSLAGTWLSRTRIGQRLEGVLHIIHDLDERLVDFYKRDHLRFAMSLLLAFVDWMLGIIEIYFVLYVIGHPISWTEAWIIESLVQMIRTAAFLIPSGIGAQEATFMLVTGSITGNPALGVSISVIRRARELVWICLGLITAWYYGTRRSEQKASADTALEQGDPSG